MTRRGFFSLRWVSITFIVIAFVLSGLQLVSYSRLRNSLPKGTVIAGVPVGGLTLQQSAERLMLAYSVPVEVRYGSSIIQIKPSSLGFQLDLEEMISAADQQRVSQPFWSGFWNYLWNRLPPPINIPLRSQISEPRLRAYLTDEIAARYDQPAVEALPVPGSINFEPGKPGSTLDIERAVVLIDDALRSPSSRVVNLTLQQVKPARPSFQNLQILLQQVIDQAKFDGITEIYVQDLETGQELSFAYSQKQVFPPNISFSAASTIKIPIMVSVFQKIAEPTPKEITDLMELMIERSENDPSDRLLQVALDRNLGPLFLTSDMRALGFENTFMAGYFYPGAPLLDRYTTPGNTRKDLVTNPDTYNQTTPAELGQLLEDMYYCSQNGGGTFALVFPGKISQAECSTMLSYMSKNRIGVLLEAGLPDGTQIAHKHGWSVEPADGLIHTIGDAGIVFTSGGKYVIVVFMYHPSQLIWDPANKLMAQISRAVYNYYNLSAK
ncbi:MAG: class A beta-lactamase-related serine hydrolase [Anaerolineaceae bacterium]|nr:class A beta-lactamase-related serine hydrolase [Anaerolineaceae bacterium]